MQKEKADNDELAKLFKNNKEFSFSEKSILNIENANNINSINHNSFMEFIKKNGYENIHYSEESTESTNKFNRQLDTNK